MGWVNLVGQVGHRHWIGGSKRSVSTYMDGTVLAGWGTPRPKSDDFRVKSDSSELGKCGSSHTK